jgi:hypothetical protein
MRCEDREVLFYTDTCTMCRRPFQTTAFILVLALSIAARTKPSPAADQDYISALAAANNFLHALQSHDEEAGILLLSDRLREHTSEDAISGLFSSVHPEQAYEISRGRKLSPGRYQFPVTLWEMPVAQPGTNAPHHWTQPRTTSLIVTRTLKDDWLIDKLP